MSSPANVKKPALERCLNLLADCLIDRREIITRLWIDGVRHHPGIPSARGLTFQQLSDHLPKLFDDMAGALRYVTSPSDEAEQSIVEDARKHGHHRWEQDFRLDELLRELSIIRSLIMRDGFDWFLQHNPVCEPEIGQARDIIIRFFEETSIGSVEQYINEQQAQLEALNHDLARIDESRLRLMGTVAHELGNSIYSLKMIMATLATTAPQSEADRERAPQSEADRERALRMGDNAFGEIQTFLNQLTDYSAILSLPKVDWDTVDLRLFCEEIERTFGPAAANAGLRFSAGCEDRLETARTDRLKLKRIASNLITNAIKFRQPDRAEGYVAFRLASGEENSWRLVVEDNGIGIAPADRERIFEEFARLPSEAEKPGAGLGLAITKRLCTLLEGQISVESVNGEGSRFIVSLPHRAAP